MKVVDWDMFMLQNSRSESEKLLHLPGKNYNKLKVLTGYKG